MLQDVFDQLVVFSEHEWIGPAADNPVARNQQQEHVKFAFEGGAADSARGATNADTAQTRLGKGDDGALRCRPATTAQSAVDEMDGTVEGRARRQSAAGKVRYRDRDSDSDGGSQESEEDDEDGGGDADDSGTRSPVRALPVAPFEVFGIARRPVAAASERRPSEAPRTSRKGGDDGEEEEVPARPRPAADSKRPEKPKPAASSGAKSVGGQQSIMSFIRPAAASAVISIESDDEGGKTSVAAAGAVKPSRTRTAQPKSYRDAGSDEHSESGTDGSNSDSDVPRKKKSTASKAGSRLSPDKKPAAARLTKSAPVKAAPKHKAKDSDDDDAPHHKPTARRSAAKSGKRKSMASDDEEEDDEDDEDDEPRRKQATKKGAAKRQSKGSDDDDDDDDWAA